MWRDNILEGARLGLTRKQFNPCAPLDVVFAEITVLEQKDGDSWLDTVVESDVHEAK